MTIAHSSTAPCKFPNLALSVALAAAFPGIVQAARINYETGVSLLHSDNIDLSPTDPVSDTVLSPLIRFDLEQTGSTLQVKARGNLEFLHYLENTFGDEVRGEFAGQLNWTVQPERMNFVVEDYLTRQPVNVLTGFSPNNQQQVNVFVAGPSFFVRWSDATRGQFDLRYSNTYAADSQNFNGNRYNAAARALHEISVTQQLSANIEATRVEFNQDTTPSYTRYDGYASYTRNLRSIDYNIDLGYSRLQPSGTQSDESTPLMRGSLDWKVSPRSVISARLYRQFSDTAQDLITRSSELDGPAISDLSYADVLVGPDVFRQRRVELGYGFTGERLTFSARPYYERIHYVQLLGQDQRSRGGYLEVGYRLRPLLTLALLAAQENRDFDVLARSDRDFTADVSLTNQFTRHWIGRIDLERRKRDSSVALQSYTENAVILTFTYRR